MDQIEDMNAQFTTDFNKLYGSIASKSEKGLGESPGNPVFTDDINIRTVPGLMSNMYGFMRTETSAHFKTVDSKLTTTNKLLGDLISITADVWDFVGDLDPMGDIEKANNELADDIASSISKYINQQSSNQQSQLGALTKINENLDNPVKIDPQQGKKFSSTMKSVGKDMALSIATSVGSAITNGIKFAAGALTNQVLTYGTESLNNEFTYKVGDTVSSVENSLGKVASGLDGFAQKLAGVANNITGGMGNLYDLASNQDVQKYYAKYGSSGMKRAQTLFDERIDKMDDLMKTYGYSESEAKSIATKEMSRQGVRDYGVYTKEMKWSDTLDAQSYARSRQQEQARYDRSRQQEQAQYERTISQRRAQEERDWSQSAQLSAVGIFKNPKQISAAADMIYKMDRVMPGLNLQATEFYQTMVSVFDDTGEMGRETFEEIRNLSKNLMVEPETLLQVGDTYTKYLRLMTRGGIEFQRQMTNVLKVTAKLEDQFVDSEGVMGEVMEIALTPIYDMTEDQLTRIQLQSRELGMSVTEFQTQAQSDPAKMAELLLEADKRYMDRMQIDSQDGISSREFALMQQFGITGQDIMSFNSRATADLSKSDQKLAANQGIEAGPLERQYQLDNEAYDRQIELSNEAYNRMIDLSNVAYDRSIELSDRAFERQQNAWLQEQEALNEMFGGYRSSWQQRLDEMDRELLSSSDLDNWNERLMYASMGAYGLGDAAQAATNSLIGASSMVVDGVTSFVGSLLGNVVGRGLGKLTKTVLGGGGEAGSALSAGLLATAAMAIGGGAWAAHDAVGGYKKSNQWLGDDSSQSKAASTIGGLLGGTGPGIADEGTAGAKTVNVLSGAGKGALIGGAVGSIVPGFGTAIGAGIGAGAGAIGSAIGGKNLASAASGTISAYDTYHEKADTPEGKFTAVAKTLPVFGQLTALTDGIKNWDTDKSAWENLGKISGEMTKTIPVVNGVLKGIQDWDVKKGWGSNLLNMGKEVLAGLPGVNTIMEGFSQWGNNYKEIWEREDMNLAEKLGATGKQTWNNIKQFGSDAYSALAAKGSEAMTAVQNAASATWNTIDSSIEHSMNVVLGSNGVAAWNTIKDTASGVYEIWNNDSLTFGQKLQESGKTAMAGIQEAGNLVLAGMSEKLSKIGQSISDWFKWITKKDTWKGFGDSIKNGVSSVGNWFSDKWDKVKQFCSDFISGYNSYDVGSPYIPYDQIAMIHKGERILTAEENKDFTENILNGSNTSSGSSSGALSFDTDLEKLGKGQLDAIELGNEIAQESYDFNNTYYQLDSEAYQQDLKLYSLITISNAKIKDNSFKLVDNSTRLVENSSKLSENSSKLDSNSYKLDLNNTRLDSNNFKLDNLSKLFDTNSFFYKKLSELGESMKRVKEMMEKVLEEDTLLMQYPENQGGGFSGSTSNGGSVIAAAKSALGIPYKWGGNDLKTGVDCSGLVQQAYKAAGIDIPRTTYDQIKAADIVSSDLSKAVPGDLLFRGSNGGYPSHVGMYIGNGQYIHAPRTGDVVKIGDMSTGNWREYGHFNALGKSGDLGSLTKKEKLLRLFGIRTKSGSSGNYGDLLSLMRQYEVGDTSPDGYRRVDSMSGGSEWAYGAYQYTAKGSMDNTVSFRNWLRSNGYTDVANSLGSASGHGGSLKSAWYSTFDRMKDRFIAAQDDYQYNDYWLPFYTKNQSTLDKLGFKVQQVVAGHVNWMGSGGASKVLRNAGGSNATPQSYMDAARSYIRSLGNYRSFAQGWENRLNNEASHIGVHESGLSRVPYDNYIAVLHKDERVLNADEAELWNTVQSERLSEYEPVVPEVQVYVDQDGVIDAVEVLTEVVKDLYNVIKPKNSPSPVQVTARRRTNTINQYV